MPQPSLFSYLRWLHLLWQRMRILSQAPSLEPVLNVLDQIYHFRRDPWERSYAECRRLGWLEDASLTYGETDWGTFLHLARQLQVSDFDVFVELGCGTGQFCFFINHFYNIPAIGIDRIPAFIDIARQVAREFNCRYLSFLEQDFLDFDFAQGTCYFVACPYFSEAMLARLVRQLARAPVNTRIASVSQPLVADYLQLETSCRGRFSWSQDTVWIYRKTGNQDARMNIHKESESCLQPKP